MTAQTISFHYELAHKGFSMEKAQHLVTQQIDLCCYIGVNFTFSGHTNNYVIMSGGACYHGNVSILIQSCSMSRLVCTLVRNCQQAVNHVGMVTTQVNLAWPSLCG